MPYISVKETAARWGLSERSVRNYCAQGRIEGAVLVGKTWQIPADAPKPRRSNARPKRALAEVLSAERAAGIRGGIYHRLQVDMAYNSNHIEGSTLTHEQTRHIFETATIGLADNEVVRVDDVVEAANHFRAFDYVLDRASHRLTPHMIKDLHRLIKQGTSDAAHDWFRVGDWKAYPNEVGGRMTTPPEEVGERMQELLGHYERRRHQSFDDLLDFHVRFERIHPFQDGNGRVGRLLLFKECLRWGEVPFVIGEDLKLFYYRGIARWDQERGWLRDTCLTAQDVMREVIRQFAIEV